MKVGVIVDNEFTNDIRVKNECFILNQAGYEVIVLALSYSKKETKEEVVNPKLLIKRISIKRKLKNIMFALFNFINIYSHWWSRHIKNFLKNENIQVIHTHDLYMAKAVYMANKNTNIPIVLDLHENYPEAVNGYKWMHKFPSRLVVRPNAWKKKERLYLKFPNKLIVLSSVFKNHLLSKYNYLSDEQFIVYPNVPNLMEFQNYKIDKTLLPKDNEFILFYFGGISKRRGIFIVLEALKLLVEEIKEIKLLLIGPVDKAELAEFNKAICQPRIKDKIIYYPWKDIKYVPSYIDSSDVCLSPIEKNPQHESGVANKLFQYMLFGKPLITSDCLPQANIVIEEQCGLVYKWDSPIDLSKKVISLYENPELAFSMGQNGMRAVKRKYNTEIMGKEFIERYTF